MSRCPDCGGRGIAATLIYSLACSPQVLNATCARCGGHGEILEGAPAWWLEIGSGHREARVFRGESLGTCARRLGLSVRELVDMEHGRANPGRLAHA